MKRLSESVSHGRIRRQKNFPTEPDIDLTIDFLVGEGFSEKSAKYGDDSNFRKNWDHHSKIYATGEDGGHRFVTFMGSDTCFLIQEGIYPEPFEYYIYSDSWYEQADYDVFRDAVIKEFNWK